MGTRFKGTIRRHDPKIGSRLHHSLLWERLLTGAGSNPWEPHGIPLRVTLDGMPEPVLLCYCCCPDATSAQAIAEAVVGERLAACVNHLPGIRSTYRWQGAVTTDDEALLLIKTTAARFDALKARLLELHPYELPELVAVPLEYGHATYLDWIRTNVDT